MKKKIVIKESVLVGKSEEEISNEFKKGLDPNEYLISAVLQNDLSKVKLLLKNGADVNYKNPTNGNTPLLYACGFLTAGKNMIEFLLRSGADVNIKNDNNQSPISLVKQKKYYDDIVKLLKKYESKNRTYESIGGAGYSVYGGSVGFGNPSMRGFSGRGGGFGGSANLGGGPNLMYTYSVKPLNQTLQQPPSATDNDQYIHTGSKISGYILNTNKKIEGQITHIEEDEDNNIKYYVVLDSEGKQRKVDPTSCFLIKHDQLDPESLKIKDIDIKESFYPLIKKTINESHVKNVMMNLAEFYANNIFDLPEGVGMDEMVDAHFPSNVYQFYLDNKESVKNLANEMM